MRALFQFIYANRPVYKTNSQLSFLIVVIRLERVFKQEPVWQTSQKQFSTGSPLCSVREG